MPHDLRHFIDWIVTGFEPRVRVGDTAGAYARKADEDFVHLYGTADMACVLYTLGRLPTEPAAREQWVATLQGLQDPQTGYLLARPADHSPLHNTAFALGALELFDAAPLHPLAFADEVRTSEQLEAFFDSFDWREGVYRQSHNGAGIAAALALVPGTVGPEWFDAYFRLTDAKFDPANGMMGDGKPPEGDFDQVGGTFHYAFMYEHFGRAMPYPAARTDAILGLQRDDGTWHERNIWWLTLDALYMLDRDQRRLPHRPDDVRAAIARATAAAAERIATPEVRDGMTPHQLTATVNLFAIAQQALGRDEIVTDRPLRLVLDRRPFI